jgi:hypothetical protein
MVPELAVLKAEVAVDAVSAVPVTVKLIVDEVTALRFPTVSVLDSPGTIVGGLKVHVAGVMSAQARTIEPANPSLVEAETANCAWPVPRSTVSEPESAVSVNEGTPVPVRVII